MSGYGYPSGYGARQGERAMDPSTRAELEHRMRMGGHTPGVAQYGRDAVDHTAPRGLSQYAPMDHRQDVSRSQTVRKASLQCTARRAEHTPTLTANMHLSETFIAWREPPIFLELSLIETFVAD